MRFVVCLSLFVIVQWGTAGAIYCVYTPNMTTPGALALPSLPPQFQTRVEATIIDKNFTVSAQEYFDGPNNRATLTMMKMGLLFKLIYDYSNDQLLYVAPSISSYYHDCSKDISDLLRYFNDNTLTAGGTCTVGNLTTNNDNMLFGNNMGGSGMPHAYTTNGALNFAKKFGEIYLGKATIRGVQVNHWQTCMYWAELKSNFTLDYYFSVPNWLTSDGLSQVPIRAEATGVQIQDDMTTRNFHHIYDYVDFRTQIYADVSMFETPAGVVCPGRIQTRRVPQLPRALIFREEIVSKLNAMTFQADIWYDENYKLVREDHRPKPNTAPYYSADRATEIHDYNTGVAYAIDRTRGNCTIIPLPKTSIDAAVNTNGSKTNTQFLPRMKSTQEFLYLDGNYSYEGQRMGRSGIMCDIFISHRNYYSGGHTYNATIEVYFLAKTWTAVNNDGNTNPESVDVPISVHLIIPSVYFQHTYNFYNFAEEEPDITFFDISPCFEEENTINFKLTFYGTFDTTAVSNKRPFLLKTIAVVAEAAGVYPIRITSPVVRMKPNAAYFIARLVDRAPHFGSYVNTKQEINLKTAWENLQNAVFRQLVSVSVQYDSRNTIYTASDIQDTDVCSGHPSSNNIVG